MKKIVLSLAGVLAATAFAPEAAAVPAFARQTGMACNACHQQHFPILNSFGRAFKAGGYNMMGAQGKVEGEHLSIPDTLNASMVLKIRYQKESRGGNTSGVNVAGTFGVTANDGLGTPLDGTVNGQMQFADEFALLFGGRVAENVGFLMEANLVGPGAALTGGLKIPFVFDMGGAKLSVIPFTTDAHGPQYGYELGSTGVLRANRWSELRRDTSAIQFATSDGNGSIALANGGGDWANSATGFAFVAQNDMGYINYTRYTPNLLPGAGGLAINSYEMKSNYVRIVATPTVGDWAIHTGVGFMSGTSEIAGLGGTGTAAVPVAGIANSGLADTKASFFDFQAHGQAGGKDLGVYASYANAPTASGTCGTGLVHVGCNAYNSSATNKKDAWQIGADYSVIPHVLNLGASYRAAHRSGLTDNALMVQAIYDYAQNIAVHGIVASHSGGRYTANPAGGQRGKSQYLLMLEMAW